MKNNLVTFTNPPKSFFDKFSPINREMSKFYKKCRVGE